MTIARKIPCVPERYHPLFIYRAPALRKEDLYLSEGGTQDSLDAAFFFNL
jgi:hypothetical protein